MGVITITDPTRRTLVKNAAAEAFGPDAEVLAMGESPTEGGYAIVLTDTGRRWGRFAVHYVRGDGSLFLGDYSDSIDSANAVFIKRVMR
jgi:hypothetical protein